MTYREAASIAFKECGYSESEFEVAARTTDLRSAGTNWPSASHNHIPAGEERREIDDIKKVLRGGIADSIPTGPEVRAELRRIKSLN